jgi:hypothetical protein
MVCFHLLLVLGVNIPGAAWGSRYEVLPAGLRFASFTAALIFILLILIVLEKLGKISFIRKPGLANAVLWFFGVYFLLNTIMNAISPGDLEKYFMTPLAFIMSALCMVTAGRKPGP